MAQQDRRRPSRVQRTDRYDHSLMSAPILFAGDPHATFDQIHLAANRLQAQAIVLLGDLEPKRSLVEEMTGVAAPWFFIHGNHDSDSDALAERVWTPASEPHDLHRRVIELPDGRRIAGLGGVFREAVWYPRGSNEKVAFQTRAEHAKATPRQDRWRGGPHRRHLGTIYPEDFDHLASQKADILVMHEAPAYHEHGFEIIDCLAQVMGARIVVHGHQHDDTAFESEDGLRCFGVGLRGVSALWPDGRWEVIVRGEFDTHRYMSPLA